jgi:hypothetical protein
LAVFPGGPSRTGGRRNLGLAAEVWGNGYSVVNGVLHTPWPPLLVLSVLIAKIFATAALQYLTCPLLAIIGG